MSRLTKHIRLVLISSSLVLPGCGRGGSDEATCGPRPAGGPNSNMPPACGPVDGRFSGYHGTGYHGYGGNSWGRGSSASSRGHSTVGGSSRGGFGSFGHGVSS